MDDIIHTLAKKHGLTEDLCRLNLNYVLDRTVEIMEEPDTIAFRFGALGYVYTSIIFTQRAKNFRHKKKEARAEKYRRLREWVQGRTQTYELRVRFRSIPRIYRKYFRKHNRRKMSNLELQNFQNEYTGK